MKLFGAVAWVCFLDYLKRIQWVGTLGILLLYDTLHPAHILGYFSKSNTEQEGRIYNARVYKSLTARLPKNVHVVMNTNSGEDIDVLFYNNNVIAAHHWTVPPADFDRLAAQKVPIAFFWSAGKFLSVASRSTSLSICIPDSVAIEIF